MSSTTKIDAIALVEGATCVLLLDHRIRCWRDYGLMQTSGPTSPPPAGAFTSIGADLFSLCGIRPDASVACWAYGEDAVDPPASTFSAVSGQCGIKTDQTLLCWYFDGEDTIVSVPLEGTFSAISSPCAIRTDGTLACWGDGYSDLTPTPTGSFKAVEARSDVACAIRTDETVACWGDPYEGQTAAPPGTFSAVGVGFFTSCGIRTDGTLTCWGDHRPKPWQPIVGTFTALTMDDGGCAEFEPTRRSPAGDQCRGPHVRPPSSNPCPPGRCLHVAWCAGRRSPRWPPSRRSTFVRDRRPGTAPMALGGRGARTPTRPTADSGSNRG